MGTVISLADHRAVRRAESSSRAPGAPVARMPATIFFDPGSPLSYLAGERAERALPAARWTPVIEDVVTGRPPAGGFAGMAAAERRADALGMPLTWPERWPAGGRSALRVAVLAAAGGRGAAFALAAGRLQFCGGFDLDDPEILAEAAAAAGIGLDAALAAAGDPSLEGVAERAARGLLRAGATVLPAFRVGRRLLSGEERLAEAVAAAGDAPRPLAFPDCGR